MFEVLPLSPERATQRVCRGRMRFPICRGVKEVVVRCILDDGEDDSEKIDGEVFGRIG